MERIAILASELSSKSLTVAVADSKRVWCKFKFGADVGMGTVVFPDADLKIYLDEILKLEQKEDN